MLPALWVGEANEMTSSIMNQRTQCRSGFIVEVGDRGLRNYVRINIVDDGQDELKIVVTSINATWVRLCKELFRSNASGVGNIMDAQTLVSAV
jgi:hypothetical protein